MSNGSQQLHPELTELADGIGEFIRYWGFKKIHGRVWALLFLSKSPLDATTLVEMLGVSKTLVSFAVRELLAYGVIQEAGSGARGTVLLTANPNISDVIVNVLREREHRMITKVQVSARKVAHLGSRDKDLFKLNLQRLGELEFFIRASAKVLKLVTRIAPGGSFFARIGALRAVSRASES